MLSDIEALKRAQYQLHLIKNAIEFQKNSNQHIDDGIQNGMDNNNNNRKSIASTQHSDQGYSNADASFSANAPDQVSFVSSSNDWHNTITNDVRRYLIVKQVDTIQSTIYQDAASENCTDLLYVTAQMCEERAFKNANTKNDYYYLMANEMYDVQNHLKRCSQKRKFNQMIQNQSSVVSTSSSDTSLRRSNSLDQDQVPDIIDLTDQVDFSDEQKQVCTIKIKMSIIEKFLSV